MLKNINIKVCLFMTIIISIAAGFGAYYTACTKKYADKAKAGAGYVVEGDKLRKAVIAHERWETNLALQLGQGSFSGANRHSCELEALLADYESTLSRSAEDILISSELADFAEKHKELHDSLENAANRFNLASSTEKKEIAAEASYLLSRLSEEAAPALNKYNQVLLQSHVPGDIAQSTGKSFLLMLTLIFTVAICGYVFIVFFVMNPMLLIKTRIEDIAGGVFKNNHDFSKLKGDFAILGEQVDLISERCVSLADEYSDVLYQMPVYVENKSYGAVCTNNFSTAKQQIQSVLYNLNKSLGTISSVSEDLSKNVMSIKEYDEKTSNILGSSIQRLLCIQEKIVDLLEVAVNAIDELGSIQDDMTLASEKTKAVSSICANMQTMVGVVDGISGQTGILAQKMADYFSGKGVDDEELLEFALLAKEISSNTKKQSKKFYRLLASSMQDLQIGNVGFKFLRKKFNRLLGYVNSAEINKMQLEIDNVLGEFSEIEEINHSSGQLGDELVKQSNIIKNLADEYVFDNEQRRCLNTSFRKESILGSIVERVKSSDKQENNQESENYWKNGALSKLKSVVDKADKTRGAHNG